MRLCNALLVLMLLTTPLQSAEPPSLKAAAGTLEKSDAAGLTIRPRGSDGQFERALTLAFAGTSKITMLVPQNRAGKIILTQRDVEPKDLAPNQAIAVIYATGPAGSVVLSAVVNPEVAEAAPAKAKPAKSKRAK